MTLKLEDKDRPAFGYGNYEQGGDFGMTKREYAAIQLRVPNSGQKWLDEMIREARRLDQDDGIRHEWAQDPKVISKHITERYQDAKDLNERPVGTICPIDPVTGEVIKT